MVFSRSRTQGLRCSQVLVSVFVLAVLAASDVAAQSLVISEYRLRGPNGANDEFIEIYNNSDSPHTVLAPDGSGGYTLVAADGVVRFGIANGTVIPARGYFLGVNSVGYSLASYPGGTGFTAVGNATYTTDIPDNAGIALFRTAFAGNRTLAFRLDAAGTTAEANTLYKEGAGIPALTPFSIDASFVRKLADGCTGSGGGGNCSTTQMKITPGPSSTRQQDTNVNSADFIFVDTNGTSAGAGQRLGAPGPQNSAAPTVLDGATFTGGRLDPCAALDSPPNRVRDFTSDPANNSTFGTLDLRKTFTNSTGGAITRLRFRVVDLATFPSPGTIADLRPRTSGAVVVTVDRSPCGAGTSNVTVLGTTLEQPATQSNGGGFNSSLSVASVTPGTPLASGASVDVRFLLGLQQTGTARFCVVAETTPASASSVFCFVGATDGGSSRAPAADFNNDKLADVAVYRPDTGQWFVRNVLSAQFGDPGDVPVPADYNGGGTTDIAVFRPSSGHWFVRDQFAVQYGDRGDLPVPGDYDGNGVADVAVYRPSTGQWFIRGGASATFGGPGFVPVPADYDGDGRDDFAVYQPSTGFWYVRDLLAIQFGEPGDIAVPADYNDDGLIDLAVYRPLTGSWFIRGQATVAFGDPGDVPVPRDFTGDGKVDIAVYRVSTGTWFVRGVGGIQFGDTRDMPIPRLGWQTPPVAGDFDGDFRTDVAVFNTATRDWFVQGGASANFGDAGDLPVPGDYNGDRRRDFAVYRPSTGFWYVRDQFAVQFGGDSTDTPVPGDYNGDGLSDVAVYRASTGIWYVRNQGSVAFGGEPGDVPVPADYNGDGVTDIAIYRPSTGFWYVRGQLAVQFGDPTDLPAPADYNGDGSTDIAVFRPSTGQWFIRNQATIQFGDPTDIPVPADFNGDGKADVAVYRPSSGHWFVRNVLSVQFGGAAFVPVVR